MQMLQIVKKLAKAQKMVLNKNKNIKKIVTTKKIEINIAIIRNKVGNNKFKEKIKHF